MARPSLVDDLLIGRALNDARRRRGLRQSEVSVATGIPLRSPQDYERGRSSVPPARRQKLAEALGLDPLVLGAPVPPAPIAEPLPADEAAWLALYHRLPTWLRALVRHCLVAPATPQEEARAC
ncbi:helix-turn-helix domain-containing protein [Methylorubrum aminovorans]|uniref:helix-turn-helix domain-containing protein n=1 Tax=Methylorubrum aminovorans TaxID=269069 RepID=UPI003C2E0555